MSIHIEHLLVDLLNNSAASNTTLWIADESLSAQELLAARPTEHLDVLSNRYDLAMRLRELGHAVTVCDFDFAQLPKSEYQQIVYRVSKERPLVHHCINESYKYLQDGGDLHLIGQKDDGIRTHGRNAEKVFANKEYAKKHGDAYHIYLRKDARTPESERQWLDSKDYARLRTCTVGDFHFTSKPGVFGWNKVDRGSAILSAYAQRTLAKKKKLGSVLDLGCAYGYLLLSTAQLGFSQRTATDNNAAAIDAARASFKNAGLDVTLSLDDCGMRLEEQFDWILCNPPFHQGFTTSSDLADKFVGQIRKLLRPQGKALIVVNQFIPLERLAQDKFSSIETVANEHGFKVLLLS